MRPLVAERFMCVASVDQSERFIGLVDRFAAAEAEGRQKYSQSSGCPSVHMVKTTQNRPRDHWAGGLQGADNGTLRVGGAVRAIAPVNVGQMWGAGPGGGLH